MADVRINEVVADVNVTDAAAMLTPPVLARIVDAVMRQLDDRKRDEHALADEQRLGSRPAGDR